MELKLKRIWRKKYTIGKLYIDGVYFCDTLEDRVIDLDMSGKFEDDEVKVMKETAIPYGKYKITLRKSPRFKRILPYLHDVPHFEGVLIHRGNTLEDTAGCILVGENSKVGMVLNSKTYENRLVQMMKGVKEITIEITN